MAFSVIHTGDRLRRGGAATGSELLHRIIEAVSVWRERAIGRRNLASLDDHLLKDIGLTRADVAAEVGKPFWRP